MSNKALAGGDGVCDFSHMNREELEALFARIEVNEVWGVGCRLTEKLTDRPALMQVIDRAVRSAQWGRGGLRLASEGVRKSWQMRRERVSPAYATTGKTAKSELTCINALS